MKAEKEKKDDKILQLQKEIGDIRFEIAKIPEYKEIIEKLRN